MRRSSLTASEAYALGQLLQVRRNALGLSVRVVAARSGVNVSSIFSLERGDILAPQPDTLRALAAALSLSITDVFTVAGWLPPNELPTLRPYLRAKYHALDAEALAAIERYIENLIARYGATGPMAREDEQNQ